MPLLPAAGEMAALLGHIGLAAHTHPILTSILALAGPQVAVKRACAPKSLCVSISLACLHEHKAKRVQFEQ